MKKLVMVFAVVGVLAAPGCGINDRVNESRGRGDAPVGKVDDEPKDVVQFPDRFGNVAHACDGNGHRIFVSTQTESGRELEVVEDKTCD